VRAKGMKNQMLSDQLLRNIKQLFIKKLELMQRRDELRTAVASGRDFFFQKSTSGDGKLLGNGAIRMTEIIGELEKVDQQMKGIDTLIIVDIETEINQADFKFTIPQHPNDAGDIIQSTEYTLTNLKDTYGGLNVDDLWTIILLKEQFDSKNIELIRREGE
jgi:hypothetical protein